MSETLDALHAAVLAAPADRTVRLVYADALDESGDPAAAVRAEFVRAHVALEATPDDDPGRAAVAARCEELFQANWIDWWAPVCAAVGLPPPFVPRHRLRDRTRRLVRSETRPPGAPYVAHPRPLSVEAPGHGFTAQFVAGFPELLYLHGPPHGLDRWAAAVPLARLRWAGGFDDASWAALDGSHLANLSELTLDRLPPDAAARVACSPHLRALTALRVHPLRPAAAVVRQLLAAPTWAGLRSLTFTGVTPPEAIVVLAEQCRLAELEALAFGIAEVPEVPNVGGILGSIGLAIGEAVVQVFGGHATPAGPIHWPDYWPALEALARAPLLRRLRELRVRDPDGSSPLDTASDLLRRLMLRARGEPPAPDPNGLFPNALVRALADGLNPDRLVRLELPAARVSIASRAELARRFGPRAVLA